MQSIDVIYKRAITTEQPKLDESRLHYYDKQQNRYISIPKEDVSEREEQLLSHFFVRIREDGEESQFSSAEQAWWNFLIRDGECPALNADRVRFLYMKLSENARGSFLEAAHTFFDHAFLVVWIGERECILIEEESDYPIQKTEAQTFLDVLAGDFYITGRLFIGRFAQASASLKNLYKRETEAARKAVLLVPEQRVTTIETVIPYLFLAQSRNELSELFAEELKWFESDDDLRHTLQLLIQNHLNVSQTAKQLHLHRNSLQYRIDKFIDRTSIDVRSYEGALLVYMLCLISIQK